MIKCAVLLLKLELVEVSKIKYINSCLIHKLQFIKIYYVYYIYVILKLAIHCLNLVKNQCEQYYYYMAVCQYKKENYSESLEYVNNEKIIGRFVSTYLYTVAIFKINNLLIKYKSFKTTVKSYNIIIPY